LELKISVISNKLKAKQLQIIQAKILKGLLFKLKAFQIIKKYIKNHNKLIRQVNYKLVNEVNMLYKLKGNGNFVRKELILNHVHFSQIYFFLLINPTIEIFKNRISFGLRPSRILIETQLQIVYKLNFINSIFFLSILKLIKFNISLKSFWFLKVLISKIELEKDIKFILIKLINFVVNKMLKDF